MPPPPHSPHPSNSMTPQPFTDLQVITFDGDGTLWDFHSAMRLALEACLAHLEARIPGITENWTVETLIEIRDQVARAFQDRAPSLIEIRYHSFLEALRQMGVQDPEPLAREITDLYLTLKDHHLKVFPEVPKALELLHSRFRLGLLSNGNTDPRRLGLAHWFDFTLFAEHIGIQKPDPAFYHLAIRTAGVPASQILHIGDSIDNDVLPAQEIGMQTLWLNRERLPNPDPSKIQEISSLMEVLDYVAI